MDRLQKRHLSVWKCSRVNYKLNHEIREWKNLQEEKIKIGVKIQMGIFQRGSLWPLLFVIPMMALNCIQGKWKWSYGFTKLKEKMNLLMNIQPKYRNEIRYWKICDTFDEKMKMSDPVGWGWRIHRLLPCRGLRHPATSGQDMTLNNLMVRLQRWWNF